MTAIINSLVNCMVKHQNAALILVQIGKAQGRYTMSRSCSPTQVYKSKSVAA